jgi:hypothetical protein
MHLNDELSIFEHHSQTMQLVVANLVAAREQLEVLPRDPRRDRLLALQQQAIDAAAESLAYSQSTLSHLRSVESLYSNQT